MAPAAYTPETVGRIRTLAAQGSGVYAVAAFLDWPSERVRSVASKHQISLHEDTVADGNRVRDGRIKAIYSPPIARTLETIEPTPRAKRTRSAHPRSNYITTSVSEAGRKKLAECANAHNLTDGGLVGTVLDYALRKGLFAELAVDALAEPKEKVTA